MRVLCVGYRVPVPVRDGGNVRAHGYLRELGRRHDVWYLCRASGPRPDAEAELAPLCRRAEIFVDAVPLTASARLGAIAGGVPFGVITPATAFFRRVRALVRTEPFDLVYTAGADLALLAEDALARTAVVWDMCDCTSRYYDRQAGTTRRTWRRLWYRRQAAQYRRLERRLLGRDLALLAASPSEAAAVCGEARPAARVHVLPTGVTPARPGAPRPGPPRITFVGSLGYLPNADAVLHFCRDILPRVRRQHAGARFDVVGEGASPELVSACRATAGVELLGFVPDLAAILRDTTVFVCPMRQGTGIKVKVLEAMAAGLAIVASPVALEGVPEARDGRHARIAASAEDFAQRVVELLGDPARRQALGERARELADGYAWDRLGDRVDRICRDEVAQRTRSGGRGTVTGP